MASVKDESKNAILPEVNMDKSIYQSFFYIFINEKVYLRKKRHRFIQPSDEKKCWDRVIYFLCITSILYLSESFKK